MTSGPLAATDDLGRELVDFVDAPAPRSDRTVGVFYLLWHGSNDMREYQNIFNNNETLEANPEAYLTPDSGEWPSPGHFAYWGKPLYGYFRSEDEWVMRRDLELLAAAQVDYLLVDASNNEVYKPQAALLMQTIVDLQSQGIKAPQVAFMTHTESGQAMEELYRTFYAPDAPYRYPSTWFHWKGKPLILGASPSDQIREFFTFRTAQWPNEPQQACDGWDWISFDRPQRVNEGCDGSTEQVAVSPAQNSGSSSIFSYTAFYNRDTPPSRSRTFHNGAEDESPGAVNHGYNFQEEWDHAIAVDPETILILEWNEWIAGNWAAKASDPLMFYDVVNTRWSRDLQPMTGGYGDNYYLQMVDNIRRYKGVEPPGVPSSPTTIDIQGGFDQWDDVAPEYHDPEGDTDPRHHAGTDGKIYANYSGRNDIVTTKVARDDANLYFYAQTSADLTPPRDERWMTLFLNVDGNGANGWKGYDYAINRDQGGQSGLRLEESLGGWNWRTVSQAVHFKVDGNQLMFALPRSALGVPADPFRLEFKWSDNRQADDVMDFYLSGDVAPAGRFSYVYDTGDHPAPSRDARVPAVDPLPVQDPGYYRIEDDNVATDYETFVTPKPSSWVTVADPSSSGGSYSYLSNPGGKGDRFYRNFIRAGFRGSSVRWLTTTAPDGTQAEIFIDGQSQGKVNLYSSQVEHEQTVFSKYGLHHGYHEIMVVFLPQGGKYYHDAFEYGVDETASTPPPGANLAANATATASDSDPLEWFPTNAGQINDDDLGSYWRGDPHAGQHEITLNFGRTVQLDRFVIVPRTVESVSSGYRVEALTGRTWHTIATGGSLDSTVERRIRMTPAQRVRLTLDGPHGDAPELYEFSLYRGDGGAEPPMPTHWEFTNDVQSWTVSPGNETEWVPGGLLRAHIAGENVTVSSPANLDVPADEFSTVRFALTQTTESREGTFWYTANGDAVVHKLPFRLSASGEQVLDFENRPGWSGRIDQFGISLGNTEAGGTLELDYVRMAPDNAVQAWHFRTDAEGWTASPGADLTWRPGGHLDVSVDEPTELRSAGDARADISNQEVVKLSIRNSSSATQATVSFATEEQPSFTAERSKTFDLVAHDGKFRTYEVQMADLPGWQGVLTDLKLDIEAGDDGEMLSLDSVRIEPEVVAQLNTKRTWEFTDSAEGWGDPGNIQDFRWESEGWLSGSITAPDPWFRSPDRLWLDIDDRPNVTVRMRVNGLTDAAVRGTLYFATEASPAFSEAHSVPIVLTKDQSGFVDYELDMSQVQGWTGVLKQLRLDPEEGSPTGTFSVDYVRIAE